MIRRLLVVWCLLIGMLVLAQQPRAWWQSVSQVAISGGGGGYTGPIDINGTAYAFWSTRCGSTSYTGNVVDVWDGATGSTTQTTITCSSGGTLNTGSPTALATTCAVSCRVKTVYDQSGANNCTGACDVTQATNASRPVFNTSLLGGKAGVVFASGSTNCLASIATLGLLNQTFSLSSVYKATSTAKGNIQSDSGGGTQFYMHESGANQVAVYSGGGAALIATASDASSHAVQGLVNGASSALYVDGSNTTGVNPGTAGIGGSTLIIGGVGAVTCTAGSQFGDMNWFEHGVWSTDKSANNASMNSNQHAYWSF